MRGLITHHHHHCLPAADPQAVCLFFRPPCARVADKRREARARGYSAAGTIFSSGHGAASVAWLQRHEARRCRYYDIRRYDRIRRRHTRAALIFGGRALRRQKARSARAALSIPLATPATRFSPPCRCASNIYDYRNTPPRARLPPDVAVRRSNAAERHITAAATRSHYTPLLLMPCRGTRRRRTARRAALRVAPRQHAGAAPNRRCDAFLPRTIRRAPFAATFVARLLLTRERC